MVRFWRGPSRGTVLVLSAAALTFGIATILPKVFPPNTVTVIVDMKASLGNQVHLYVNDLSKPPFAQAVVEGQRHTYIFSGLPAEDIKVFRLDPVDVVPSDVDLYSVDIRDARGTVRHFAGADLGTWQKFNENVLPMENGAFHFTCNTVPSVMYANERIALRRTAPVLVNKFFAAIQSPDLASSAFIIVLFVASALGDRERLLHLPLAGAILVASFFAMSATLRSIHSLDPVSRAVGRASFTGVSTRASVMATFAAAAAACLLAVGFKLLADSLQRRGLMKANDGAGNADVELVGRLRRFAIPLLVCLLIALLNCPDLLGTALYRKTSVLFTPQWDLNNLTYWTYLVHLGYLPYRDFWYPYSGLYTFEEPLPWGPLFSSVYRALLYSLLFYTFYRFWGRRVFLAFFVTLVLLVGDWTGVFQNAHRYLLAIAVFLSYLILQRLPRPSLSGLAVFWFACALAFFVEPMQLVSAATAIAAIVMLDWWQDRSRSGLYWRERAIREFAVPLVSIGLIAICFAVTGQLAGLTQLYLRAGDSAAYGAIPTDLSWLKHISLGAIPGKLTDYSSLILFGPPLCIGLGLFEKLRHPRISDHRGEALVGLGVIYLVVLQKHLIRPMPGQFLLYLLAALLVYAAGGNRRRTAMEYLTSGFVLGFAIFVLFEDGQVDALAGSVKASPKRIFGDMQALTSKKALLSEANASYFAPAHFERFPEEQQVAARLRALSTGETSPQVFVMADDAVIYILVGQTRPMFYANLYNASPIYEQQRLVNWMAAAKPQFVVFEPGDWQFDNFQKLVRLPLIFEAVIRNYVPQEAVGRFEILRSRRAYEPIAIAYWRDKLTPAVDFGYLASLSRPPESSACQGSSNADCRDFLAIRVAGEPQLGDRPTIPFEIGELAFTLTFNATPRQHDYYVPLDRFWPWRAGRDANLTARVAGEKLAPGVTAKVVGRRVSKDVLY